MTAPTSPTAAMLGRIGLPEPVRALCRAAMGCHRRRGGAQRADLRGVPGPGGATGPGAGGAGPGRRGLHARRGLAGLSDLAVRVPGRAAAPAGDRGARPAGPRVPTGSRRAAGCSCRSRTAEHPALGRRRALRGRDPPASRRATSTAGGRCGDVKRRLRDALRPDGRRRPLGRPAPRLARRSRTGSAATTRPASSCSSGRWSSYVEHYLEDERLQMAYLGQGVIGTNASPHDPGTASIHFHHASGRLGGHAGDVGIRQGGDGHGLVPPLRRRARGRAPWWRPGCRWPGSCRARGWSSRGASGSTPRRRLQRRPARDAPPARRRGRPGLARPGRGDPDDRLHGQAQRALCASCPTSAPGPGPASRTTSARSTRRSRRPSGGPRHQPRRRGRAARAALDRALLPDRARPERRPRGVHTMSVFAQYVPYTLRARGTGTSRREEVERPGAGLDRAVLRQHPRAVLAVAGARPARHRARRSA